MASSHVQTGARVDIVIPFGDTLDLALGLARKGVAIDASTLTLVGEILDDQGIVAATLSAGSDVDGNATVAGGDDVPVGSYRWALRDTVADVTVAYGGYWVTAVT